jgi:hypothetical protein
MLRVLVRPLVLLIGTAFGGWAAVRMQFGFMLPLGRLDEELSIVAIGIGGSLVVVPLIFLPASIFVERFVSSRVAKPVMVFVSVFIAVLLGIWVYAGFLHRSLVFVFQRDFPFVLCFSLFGLGYGLARVATAHLTSPPSGQPQDSVQVER